MKLPLNLNTDAGARSAAARKAAVTRRNNAFHAMPSFKRRMSIAKDVLASLEACSINVNTGNFVMLPRSMLYSVEVGQQLQPSLLDPESRCSVCALGACFVSAVKLGNNFAVTAGHIDNPTLPFMDVKALLRKHFSVAQLQLIEIAFEEGRGWWKVDSHELVISPRQFHAAQRFGSNASDRGSYHDRSANKLKAIMNNIINNLGTFKP